MHIHHASWAAREVGRVSPPSRPSMCPLKLPHHRVPKSTLPTSMRPTRAHASAALTLPITLVALACTTSHLQYKNSCRREAAGDGVQRRRSAGGSEALLGGRRALVAGDDVRREERRDEANLRSGEREGEGEGWLPLAPGPAVLREGRAVARAGGRRAEHPSCTKSPALSRSTPEVGLSCSIGRAPLTALTQAAPPATPGKIFCTGAPALYAAYASDGVCVPGMMTTLCVRHHVTTSGTSTGATMNSAPASRASLQSSICADGRPVCQPPAPP